MKTVVLQGMGTGVGAEATAKRELKVGATMMEVRRPKLQSRLESTVMGLAVGQC